MIRSAVAAAAAALAVSACCIDVAPDDACVVELFTPRPYCYELVTEDVQCWDGRDAPGRVAGDTRVCEGRIEFGDDCRDHGFTVSCGAYRVRPGDPC